MRDHGLLICVFSNSKDHRTLLHNTAARVFTRINSSILSVKFDLFKKAKLIYNTVLADQNYSTLSLF